MLTSIFRAGTISVHLTIEAMLVHRMVEFARSASIFISGIKAADKVATSPPHGSTLSSRRIPLLMSSLPIKGSMGLPAEYAKRQASYTFRKIPLCACKVFCCLSILFPQWQQILTFGANIN